MGERSVPITLALGCWSATTRRISVSYAPKRNKPLHRYAREYAKSIAIPSMGQIPVRELC